MHVTFFEGRRQLASRGTAGADIFAAHCAIIGTCTRRWKDPMTAPKRLAVVMDPIGAIKYAKDTTLAMLLAAQARGFALPTSSSATCRCATAWPTGACAP